MARLKSHVRSTDRLKKWVQEASSLLVGMCRDERHDSAHELQQFVVKSLQVGVVDLDPGVYKGPMLGPKHRGCCGEARNGADPT